MVNPHPCDAPFIFFCFKGPAHLFFFIYMKKKHKKTEALHPPPYLADSKQTYGRGGAKLLNSQTCGSTSLDRNKAPSHRLVKEGA